MLSDSFNCSKRSSASLVGVELLSLGSLLLIVHDVRLDRPASRTDLSCSARSSRTIDLLSAGLNVSGILISLGLSWLWPPFSFDDLRLAGSSSTIWMPLRVCSSPSATSPSCATSFRRLDI